MRSSREILEEIVNTYELSPMVARSSGAQSGAMELLVNEAKELIGATWPGGLCWEDVVTECEQILGLGGHAENPMMSNVPNAVKDLKHEIIPGVKKETIIVCPECGGLGKTEESELVNHHNNISDYWDEKCEECDGHGRVVLEIFRLTRKLTEKELALSGKPPDD